MKLFVLSIALMVSQLSFADVTWKNYSDQALEQATKEGKSVVLGFHKKGCGTCHAQDKALESTGIIDKKNIVFLKVERKNEDHGPIYKKYGFSQRQWASLILLKKGKEVARVNPGVTDKMQIQKLADSAI